MNVIVILGGGIDEKGNLPKHVFPRIEKAVELFKKSNEPRMIVTSAKYSFLYPKDKLPPRTESQAIRDALLERNIKRRHILMENTSRDTIGNAYYLKKQVFLPRRWKSGSIITSTFHRPRVQYIFETIFGPSYDFSYIHVQEKTIPKAEEQAVIERQKQLIEKIKKFFSGMKPGDHNFLKNKMYKAKYYKEHRAAWVVRFVAEGK